ncbi:importin-alpha export receptor KNAG_0I00260 [Huiozyma naganishii CBS 8797]|uniref:Importin N-terminal domain-containing protein n=1 Tax=Huiozyma naganishii (strain ATCC MYA-139 / BCRC 22969 / CBS 8797 / KCTC 17520 / NBRC 10181 / NCYC 3082 / Yp74L-3) TaxID=1071383 RepID=J7S239_HUIN7|nr:hypothetical protein KNAG_0I00260 [Kazachstania naganishii CBS 8797]CCK71817.1 hypothetical protein KNAG_0I00260 [Kazachstania naganishii CBS 8797]
MSELETVSKVLAESVIASTARSSEKSLKELESQDGFGLTLLHVVASTNLPISTRLAGALFFKNFIRRKWVDENGNHLLSENSIELIKKEIVPLMISLPNNLQSQIGEAISLIADSDFPGRWPGLLHDLVIRLNPNDMVLNKGVLIVAHSIFKRWRPLFRSDELFLEIKMVLDVFTGPFLDLLKTVDQQIDANAGNEAQLNILFDVLLVLIKLYYDFNCQDIPEFFEDNVNIGMTILHKYLNYKNPLLNDADDPEHVTVLIKVKSCIQEVVQLYTTRYEDIFGPMINNFIEITWQLLISLSGEPKYDILVSKSLGFLTAVTRNPKYFEIFNSPESMDRVTDQIILPNVTLRESDEELFEDDPIEYIRRDIEGSDDDTRRKACTDFLKELKEKNEVLVTNTFLAHMKGFFEKYESNPAQFWKYKDLYVYLFSTLAISGSLSSSGVISTNPLLDIVDFFKQQIIPDLTNQSIPHIILRVDAIKFIYVFRNQLTKEQLIEIMPLLAKYLNAEEYVLYTYAAITIEKILTIRASISSPQLIFQKEDLAGSGEILLRNLIGLILKQGNSPEKLAENEFLMKASFRVLQTAETAILPIYPDMLNQLIGVVSVVSKNPSNPRFSHYTFEAIGVILNYTSVELLPPLIEMIIPVFLHILSEDIQEFIPYVLQTVAYLVEKSGVVIGTIRQLPAMILAPSVWELKGNVPAVTRLLKAFIKVDATLFPDLVPVLGVFQRLIASKAYEVHGFELLEDIMLTLSPELLKPYLKQIAVLLLQRLQSSKTERYVKKFIVFLSLITIKLGGDFTIQFIDEVQEGVFQPIWSNFVLEYAATIANILDRKIALVGLATMVNGSSLFTNKYGPLVAGTINVLVQILVSENIAHLNSELIDLDNTEEISTFGSSYSRLASIADKPLDPLPNIDHNVGLKKYVTGLVVGFVETHANVGAQLAEATQIALTQLLQS